MEDQTTAQFISALAHLQPSHSPITAEELATLDGWSHEQLKHEVIRLRRMLGGGIGSVPNHHQAHIHHHNHHVPHPNNMGPVNPGVGVGVGPSVGQMAPVPQDMGLDRMGQQPELLHHLPAYGYVHSMSPVMQQHTPTQSHSSLAHHVRKRSFTEALSPAAAAAAAAAAAGTPTGSTRGKRSSRHDSGTGKRVERGRRVELQRAIRAKMRYMMGIGLDEDLPPPSEGDVGTVGWVPSWTAGVGDARNAEWLDRVVSVFINEATNFHQWTKVPPEDLETETVKAAARTAFQNFAKRYLAEIDPKQAKKQQKYVKNRRRWARKDLKQKRRAKAAQDPSFMDIHLPPSALHIDYMSSEYSSPGEEMDDEDGLDGQRKGYWMEMLQARSPEGASNRSGKGGWAEGVSEKVLEVRSPTWRSDRLAQIYRRLDTISSAQAAMRATPAALQSSTGKAGTGTRLGHVAPSHQRFTMPSELKRRGHAPRDPGEPWMWASGQVGHWPEHGKDGYNGRTHDAMSAAVRAVQRGDGMDPNSVEAIVEGWGDVS
ncbi:hypothetical protein CC85DRAFT_284377 [Cutaneotrichosporon oleaginosum]|uniref:Uncharacterized protein n=1 Tax=Cutaneotrichosporon oleaginosum TaxID=879819 RepID=A0A0J0XRD7_9TREE|nr:uncharacterized protein CC85DRAFT_284377 [Cutaneotrichosporon oleaginosum]KLT43660.1 hypothetical protein CC85DRAFT_284377 [Cutaneotrichosporon oleaginosum]